LIPSVRLVTLVLGWLQQLVVRHVFVFNSCWLGLIAPMAKRSITFFPLMIIQVRQDIANNRQRMYTNIYGQGLVMTRLLS
jgi:hypothetical protein